mmetsp:Transcript_76803/g.212205  ORF Transcript_76803/g.212205 Transcript_76803/m.212205 type:complete len:210 (+) Transcript_76803:208-837(+)
MGHSSTPRVPVSTNARPDKSEREGMASRARNPLGQCMMDARRPAEAAREANLWGQAQVWTESRCGDEGKRGFFSGYRAKGTLMEALWHLRAAVSSSHNSPGPEPCGLCTRSEGLAFLVSVAGLMAFAAPRAVKAMCGHVPLPGTATNAARHSVVSAAPALVFTARYRTSCMLWFKCTSMKPRLLVSAQTRPLLAARQAAASKSGGTQGA